MKQSNESIFITLVARRWWKNAHLRELTTHLQQYGTINWSYTDFADEEAYVKELAKKG